MLRVLSQGVIPWTLRWDQRQSQITMQEHGGEQSLAMECHLLSGKNVLFLQEAPEAKVTSLQSANTPLHTPPQGILTFNLLDHTSAKHDAGDPISLTDQVGCVRSLIATPSGT